MVSSQPFHVDGTLLGETASGHIVTAVPLATADASRLAQVFAGIPPWSLYPYRTEKLFAYLAGRELGRPRVAICVGREIAGVAGVQRDWLCGPYLQFLGIVPEYQGRGLGGLFLSWMEREAGRVGARNLWVCASDFNARALEFYERHGFARVATLVGLVQDDRDEILLRKRIAT